MDLLTDSQTETDVRSKGFQVVKRAAIGDSVVQTSGYRCQTTIEMPLESVFHADFLGMRPNGAPREVRLGQLCGDMLEKLALLIRLGTGVVDRRSPGFPTRKKCLETLLRRRPTPRKTSSSSSFSSSLGSTSVLHNRYMLARRHASSPHLSSSWLYGLMA